MEATRYVSSTTANIAATGQDRSLRVASDALRRAEAGRKGAHRLRRISQRLTENRRHGWCGIGVASVSADVEVVALAGRARYRGLQHCGLGSECYPCAEDLGRRRSVETSVAVFRHLAQGGGAYFATLTFPHTVADPLAETLGVALGGCRYVLGSREYKVLRDRFGIDYVRRIEATVGANGWHPHAHWILFTARPLTDDERRELRYVLWALWADYVKGRGYRQPQLLRCELERVKSTNVGKYIAKFTGLALEVARPEVKTGREGKGRSPFHVLRDYGQDGDPDDRRRWREWLTASRNRRLWSWSTRRDRNGKTFRQRLQLDPLTLTPEEEVELLGDTESRAERVVCWIGVRTWREVARVPGLDVRVLECAERDGLPGVVELLEATLPSGPHEVRAPP